MPTNNERKMSCGTDAPLTLSVIASSRWGPGGILPEARAGAHERRRRQSHVVVFQGVVGPCSNFRQLLFQPRDF